MNLSSLTRGQRAVVFLLLFAIVIVFSMFAGFVMSSVQSTPSPVAPSPTPLPPSPTPEPTAPPPTPTLELEEGIGSQVYYARLVGQIEQQVGVLRGLSPRSEVPLNFLGEWEMRGLLRQVYVGRDPARQLLPYVILGILPDAPISIQIHQVVGAYVPEQEQFYVVMGQQEVGADDRALLLAHAYTHVLQDQYFDLEQLRVRARTTDGWLAGQALVEGDALLLTALYSREDLAEVGWLRLAELVMRTEVPGYGEALEQSAAWMRLRRFPYWEGRQLAVALYEAGGWQAIDRAYADPPRSTEQVLHLDRYLGDGRDAPTGVFVPDLGNALGAGWSPFLRDTMGELVIGLYLEETLPQEAAWRAADGWDGDTLVVWERVDGRRVRVWRSVWDDTAEAAEFEDGLLASVEQRYLPVRPLDPPRDLPGRWWETPAGAVWVYRVARYVTFVEAPDVETLAGVVDALP